jgi:hypothetical protein
VTSYFEVFIETNLMVQSKFNLVFWFVSYNIFLVVKLVGPALVVLSLLLSLTRVCGQQRRPAGYLLSVTLNNADVLALQDRMPYPLQMNFTLRIPLSLYRMDIAI